MNYLSKELSEKYFEIIMEIHLLKNSITNKVPALKNELEEILTQVTGVNHFGGDKGQRRWLINNQIRRKNGQIASGTIPEDIVSGIINLFANRNKAEHDKIMDKATYLGIFALMAKAISCLSNTPIPVKIQAVLDGKDIQINQKENKPDIKADVGNQNTENGEFKAGDRGPAGGFIFYDKGSYSDNWRYLEAAPAKYEFFASWGVNAYNNSILNEYIDSTQTKKEVGRGKRNTEYIKVWLHRHQSYGNSAAEKCLDLKINGFNDWFLPSIGEL